MSSPKIKKTNLNKIAIFQALGIFIYCSLVGFILLNGESLFGDLKKVPILGPILFLTLFSTSALICGLLVFYNPVKIFFSEKNIKDPLLIVLYTAAWLFIITLLVLTSMVIIK